MFLPVFLPEPIMILTTQNVQLRPLSRSTQEERETFYFFNSESKGDCRVPSYRKPLQSRS